MLFRASQYVLLVKDVTGHLGAISMETKLLREIQLKTLEAAGRSLARPPGNMVKKGGCIVKQRVSKGTKH
jgi:hypothetical protein